MKIDKNSFFFSCDSFIQISFDLEIENLLKMQKTLAAASTANAAKVEEPIELNTKCHG